jgi:hypothetical protein
VLAEHGPVQRRVPFLSRLPDPSLQGEGEAGQGYYRVDAHVSAGSLSVRLSYNAPEYLKRRHGLRGDLLKNISGIGALIDSAAG